MGSILELSKNVQFSVQALSDADNYASNYVFALQSATQEVNKALTLNVNPRDNSELDSKDALFRVVKARFPNNEHIPKLIETDELNIGTIYETLEDKEILAEELKLSRLGQSSWRSAWEKIIPFELSERLRTNEILRCIQTFVNVICAEKLKKSLENSKESDDKYKDGMKKAIENANV